MLSNFGRVWVLMLAMYAIIMSGFMAAGRDYNRQKMAVANERTKNLRGQMQLLADEAKKLTPASEGEFVLYDRGGWTFIPLDKSKKLHVTFLDLSLYSNGQIRPFQGRPIFTTGVIPLSYPREQAVRVETLASEWGEIWIAERHPTRLVLKGITNPVDGQVRVITVETVHPELIVPPDKVRSRWTICYSPKKGAY